MAKADVLVRRIRAYDRVLDAVTDPAQPRRHNRMEAERFQTLRGMAVSQLENFLRRSVGAGQSAKGPWSKFANAEEAVIGA